MSATVGTPDLVTQPGFTGGESPVSAPKKGIIPNPLLGPSNMHAEGVDPSKMTPEQHAQWLQFQAELAAGQRQERSAGAVEALPHTEQAIIEEIGAKVGRIPESPNHPKVMTDETGTELLKAIASNDFEVAETADSDQLVSADSDSEVEFANTSPAEFLSNNAFGDPSFSTQEKIDYLRSRIASGAIPQEHQASLDTLIKFIPEPDKLAQGLADFKKAYDPDPNSPATPEPAPTAEATAEASQAGETGALTAEQRESLEVAKNKLAEIISQKLQGETIDSNNAIEFAKQVMADMPADMDMDTFVEQFQTNMDQLSQDIVMKVYANLIYEQTKAIELKNRINMEPGLAETQAIEIANIAKNDFIKNSKTFKLQSKQMRHDQFMQQFLLQFGQLIGSQVSKMIYKLFSGGLGDAIIRELSH